MKKARKSTQIGKSATTIKRTRKSSKKPIEQYEHKDKQRINNPPVGLVSEKTDIDEGKKTYCFDPHIDPELQFDNQRSEIENIIDSGLSAETIEQAKTALTELKKRQEPYLNWAGKAERTTFEVSTVSLHVHERIDPRSIIEAVRKKNTQNYEQMSLFRDPEENPPLREAIEFYKHKHNWSNRLIAGDSLEVMNSLIEKEGMAGQVQMIYMDPPYGIKYGSNFQPFVNKRDVKDGKDEDLTAEPEQIRAFRDTWELDIHSYLSYLRDRLLLSRELLAESGSIFVQISDENLHLVRNLLDEIFSAKNFVTEISFKTKIPLTTKHLANISDYLILYAKNKSQFKYRQLWLPRDLTDDSEFAFIDLGKGEFRRLIRDERQQFARGSSQKGVFRRLDLSATGGGKTTIFPVEFKGEKFYPAKSKGWKTTQEGMKNLQKANRIFKLGGRIYYKLFFEDAPVSQLSNLWPDTAGGFTEGKTYVVQTNPKVVERCVLMTTDPGDLIIDPTCGSGTTAFVAERWGRRWITCDTSRVATSLTKQRLLTELFDFYVLAFPEEGVSSGFKYKSTPHITLGAIAKNEISAEETLFDQPYIDKSKARVSGPFTVEAVPAPMVKPLDEIIGAQPADESATRSGETHRQAEWRDELLKTGIRGKGGQRINFSRVESLGGTRYLHADAETRGDKPQRVVVSFGPEHAPLEQRQVEAAIEEARTLVPQPEIIVFAAFQFDPEAAKDIEETNWPGVNLLKVQMNTDLLTGDLKKKRASNESFWLIGQPDIVLRQIKEKGKSDRYELELLGFDYFNTRTGEVESGGTDKIAMWMLDTDYDGRSLFPRQVFFPMAGPKDGWARLAKNLKAEIDEELIEQYRGTVSIPFEPGEHKTIAVKIVDDRGIESLRIVKL